MRTFLDDTEVLRWQLTDKAGEPINLTAAAVALQLSGPDSTVLYTFADILTPSTDGKVEVQFTVGFFPKAGDYTGRWHVQLANGQVSSIPGVIVRVYDGQGETLWANLLDLEGLVGPVDDINLALTKLEAATSAVKGYIFGTLDPDLPIPDRIRQATAIIAARLYTAPVPGADAGRIASEAIGDYRISYQKEVAATSLVIGSDALLANLLAPWHPSTTANLFIGPDYDDAPLPIEAETITDEDETVVEEPVLDMAPTTLNIEGVRAGDSNTRSFALTSGGNPYNITDVALVAMARQNPLSPFAALTAVIEVTDAENGRFDLSWPGDQVALLVIAQDEWVGVWDLQATEAGEEPVTMLQGTIQCVADVTR